MTTGKKNTVKAVLDAVVEYMTTGINGVLFIIMVGMALVLGANISMRFLFDSPISWSNAITRYAYIYIVLLGTAISYIEGSHAQIDAVYALASPRMKAIFDLCHYLVMMFLCAILIIYGIKHAITMWGVHSPVVTSMSIGIVYLSVPISAAVIFIFLIKKLFEIKF